MHKQTSIVVTSISAPNGVLRSLATGSLENGILFYVIGDVRSPADFSLEGCDFYGLERQAGTGFRFAEACPTRHYARKNIGYLIAMRDGAKTLIETDDDNYPLPAFWAQRRFIRNAPLLREEGWVNVYAYFSDSNIWPRGLPLDAILTKPPSLGTLSSEQINAPIQQGLADENPDVDAIYRLVCQLPLKFKPNVEIALGRGAWCPFNSQNTTWSEEAFPLLYLPAYCSFRMTDIWRSFVAQRIAWENDWSILFESSTVWQDRNDHDLMRDFSDEVPGYLHNRKICDALQGVRLKSGTAAIGENLRICYEALVAGSFVKPEELDLVDAWLHDLAALKQSDSPRDTNVAWPSIGSQVAAAR